MNSEQNIIYLGKEIEGKDLGELTLFIPRGVAAFSGVSSLLKKITTLECKRLYFGAKERRGLDKEDVIVIEELLKKRRYNNNYQILIEVENFDWVTMLGNYEREHVEIVFVVKTTSAFPISHFKVEDSFEVQWYKLNKPSKTSLKDTEYQNDIPITV